LKQGEVGEAIAVFTSLSAGICAGYETIWDEESEVGRILDACVDGLEGCLDAVEVDARGDILGALLDIAVWERMSGGYGPPFPGVTTAKEHPGRALTDALRK